MPRRHAGRFVLLLAAGAAVFGLLRVYVVEAPAAQTVSAPSAPAALRPARVSSAHRRLNLPEVPYQYADARLPRHFLTEEALAFDNTPEHNPITDHGATLGRVLFYDTRLSKNDTIACASCHVQTHAFDDPNRFSAGFEGGRTDRAAMNLVNLRYHRNGRFFWDERGETLESMVLLPVENSVEMGQDPVRLPSVLARDPRYPPLFEKAFGTPEITRERIALALAQFIRSLVSFNSRFDEGRAAVADVKADFPNYSLQENRGKALFLRNCAVCHLSKQDAHFVLTAPANTGLDADAHTTDGGVGDISLRPADLGRFKSPSLRNVAVTAPYMHDGRFATLEEVLDHYSSGGREHPNRDIRVQPLHLTASEKAVLIAFLRTLTDPTFLTDPKYADPFE